MLHLSISIISFRFLWSFCVCLRSFQELCLKCFIPLEKHCCEFLLLYRFSQKWNCTAVSKTSRHYPCFITEDRRRWGGWTLSSQGKLNGVIQFYSHLLCSFLIPTTSEETQFNHVLYRNSLTSSFSFFFFIYIFISMTFSNANQCVSLPLLIFYIVSANWPLCCEINSWEQEFWDVS